MKTRNWLGKWFPQRPTDARPDLLVEPLESRILYSAAPAADIGLDQVDLMELDPFDFQAEVAYLPDSGSSRVETAVVANPEDSAFVLYDRSAEDARFILATGVGAEERLSTLTDSFDLENREVFVSLVG